MGCSFGKSAKADKYAVRGDNVEESKVTGAPGEAADAANKDSSPSAGAAAAATPAAPGSSSDAAAKLSDSRIANYTGAKPKLDPADFRFVDLLGEVRVKAPGTVNGQAFRIQNCTDCDLYVIDSCAQVMIDKCINCRIFIGPTEGSIFIRNSTSCKCAFICRQLRTRDCISCDTALFCRTRPVIETSSKMGFSCYAFNYETLPAHLKSVRMSVLHNFWSHIYDFNPREPKNFHVLPEKEGTVEHLLFSGSAGMPDAAKKAFGSSYGTEGDLITTWGDRTPQPSSEFMFVLFPEAQLENALKFAKEAQSKATILRTNQAALGPEAECIVNLSGWDSSVEKSIKTGAVIGFEICGDGCRVALTGIAKGLGGHWGCNSLEVAEMFRYLGIDG